MATTTVDLKIGINLEIGSIPVSLDAEVDTDNDRTVYTFDGCMQTAEINIGNFISYIGQQFGVDVELPPELNLEAEIDYIAGQVISTIPKSQTSGENGNNPPKQTTEMGASAKFDLIYQNGGKTESFTFTFYADTILTKGDTEKAYVVGGSVDTDLQFSKLPLVGDVPVFKDYSLKNLGFSYTNIDPSAGEKSVKFNIPKVNTADNPLYTRSSDTAKNQKSYSIDRNGDQTTFNLAKKGFSFTAGLVKGTSGTAESNFALPMALPPTTPTNTPATYYQKEGATVQSSPPASPVHWIKINKTFGPIQLQQLGVNYKSGEATFGFSAGFTLGGFSLELQGLTITFPLPLPGMPAGKELSFALDGLGMEFKKGNLTIGGAFLKTIQEEITNYFGEVIVQVGNFGFKALGGYAPAQQGLPASFFLYAKLDGPLGGPPYLYVSGLAFGFGINRSLILPNIETLPGYLLLPSSPLPASSTPSEAISQVMPKMEAIFKDEPGEYWVAAGLQFTSFDMISAFGLITVSFGVELQIGLLGSCSITLPKGAAKPLAYIEIDLIASFTPSTGLLSVEGVINPASYLMGDFVKLSGGFAFYIWFSGTHKGDFVVSLGGYHPAYTKPDWYPDVPRIQLDFVLGPFQATGQAYLALTPSMFMAGLKFDAVFKAGPIKAWFMAGVDFLIGWAPFLYLADAYVNIGCSVDLGLFTIKIDIGAELNIWGPPFGGKALVDLDIVSFTITFGSTGPETTPVSWKNLETDFLPKTGKDAVPPPKTMRMARLMGPPATLAKEEEPTETANVTASVAAGLLKKDYDHCDWIVDPDHFMIVTATSIPANVAQWTTAEDKDEDIPNDPHKYGDSTVDVSKLPYLELEPGTTPFKADLVWNPDINVKPMKLKQVTSVHTITLQKADADGNFEDYITTLAIQPVLGPSNTALWGDPDASDSDPNTPTLIEKTLLGFNLLPLPRNPDTVNNVPLITLLFTPGNQTTFDFPEQKADTDYQVHSDACPPDYPLKITVSGAADQSFTNENYILSTLIDSWVTEQRNAVLNDLTANGFSTFIPDEVQLQDMGTTEALTDWPMVAILVESVDN